MRSIRVLLPRALISELRQEALRTGQSMSSLIQLAWWLSKGRLLKQEAPAERIERLEEVEIFLSRRRGQG